MRKYAKCICIVSKKVNKAFCLQNCEMTKGTLPSFRCFVSNKKSNVLVSAFLNFKQLQQGTSIFHRKKDCSTSIVPWINWSKMGRSRPLFLFCYALQWHLKWSKNWWRRQGDFKLEISAGNCSTNWGIVTIYPWKRM